MEKIIKQRLSEKRYRHSLAVANLARELAEAMGEDAERAYLAGLVHDIAKEMPVSELTEFCNSCGIYLSDVEKNNPALIHAPAGAEMLKDYGINDTEILNAVRYHTVGRAGMTTIEKIIYLADMTEPERVYPEAEELRSLMRDDFDSAFALALKYSIIWNIQKGCLVHEGTLQAWNSVISERNKSL